MNKANKSVEADPGQLLQSLKRHACKESLSDRSFETRKVGSSTNSHFVLVVCLDLGELINHSRVVDRKSAKT